MDKEGARLVCENICKRSKIGTGTVYVMTGKLPIRKKIGEETKGDRENALDFLRFSLHK